MLRNSLPQSKDEGISKIQDENLANPQPSDSIDGEGKKISKRKRGCLITTNACSSCKTARSKVHNLQHRKSKNTTDQSLSILTVPFSVMANDLAVVVLEEFKLENASMELIPKL